MFWLITFYCLIELIVKIACLFYCPPFIGIGCTFHLLIHRGNMYNDGNRLWLMMRSLCNLRKRI